MSPPSDARPTTLPFAFLNTNARDSTSSPFSDAVEVLDIIADRMSVIAERGHQYLCIRSTPYTLHMLPVTRIGTGCCDQACMGVDRGDAGQGTIAFGGIEGDGDIVGHFRENRDYFHDLAVSNGKEISIQGELKAGNEKAFS